MSFEDVCAKCIGSPELVKEWNRLTGNHLGERRTPIDRMIDEVCGHDPDVEAIPAFVRFVYECIWVPLADSNGGEAT